MAYITATDIQARLSADAYLRTFDRNGEGAVDSAFVTTCINEGHSRLRMKLGADFPEELDAGGATVDEALIGCEVAYALRAAEKYNALSTDDKSSPYKALADDADAFLDALRKDDGARLQTSHGGRALPRASNTNVQTDAGDYTNPFGRAADGKDPSGY